MSTSLDIGARLSVRVIRLLPFGLLVQLKDGKRGIIRTRELFWRKREGQVWRDHFKIGDRYEVVLLNDNHNLLELSLRLSRTDPWANVEERYQKGDLVEGTVTGIATYGAFIQLEPAVAGLLHRTQIPSKAQVEELLWIGDTVRVLVESVDKGRRRIGLSMLGLRAHHAPKELDQNRHSQKQNKEKQSKRKQEIIPDTQSARTTLFVHDTVEMLPQEDHDETTLQSRLGTLARQNVRSIVVIEDDRHQRFAVRRWLRDAGQSVRATQDAESGWELIKAHAPDIVLSDVGLPGEDGIALIRRVRQHLPQIDCVLMTDWGRAEERLGELDELAVDGVRLLIKPLLPEDLVEVLDGKSAATDQNRRPRDPQQLELGQVSNLSSATEKPHEQRVVRMMRNQIRRLRRASKATKVILFELDRHQRQIHLLLEDGSAAINPTAIPDLMHSPVRDVAEERTIVRIEEVAHFEAFTRKLRPLLPFKACLGLPLEADLPTAYALFLFFPKPTSFGRVMQDQAEAVALALYALLKEQMLLNRQEELQRLALIGHLTRALVHEINHQLGPVNLALGSLQTRCATVKELIEEKPANAIREMQRADRTLGQLNRSVENLVRTSRMFGRMTVQDQEAIIRIDRILESAVEMTRDLAYTAKTRVHYTPPEQILFTRVKASQIQQVVLNVLLNAIQQIQQLYIGEGGNIYIWTGRIQRDGETYIQICIEDDGPGIHRRRWEQIFELGFTTREHEGSGLGLYIARRLVEDVGGRIFCAMSHIFWGTRIEIEIPVHIT